MTRIGLLLVALTLCSQAWAAPFDEANAAFKRGDYATAMLFLRPLAEKGNTLAQVELGAMYHGGLGVPQDYVQAHKWFNIAASRFPASQKQARDLALKARDAIATMMTPAQIAEAQQLAREWKPK